MAPKILVEGESTAVYLKATMGRYSASLASLVNYIENPGGWSQVDERLGELLAAGENDSVFVVWDQDVLASSEGMPATNLNNHPLSHPFPGDFEELFPDWMVADALVTCDPHADYPSETEIRASCRAGSPNESFYERLQACVKDCAAAAGRDPAAVDIPSKVELARCLAEVANRMWYQPEEMRRLLDRLREWIGDVDDSPGLIADGVSAAPFVLNTAVFDGFGLRGKLALSLLPDLWLIGLDSRTATRLVPGLVAGPPCWSHDGSRIAFGSKPSQYIYNSEAIQIYDVGSGQTTEHLRMGKYLCWGKDGRVYANSLGWKLCCALNPKSGDRRNLPLPEGSIVACVDRRRDRILIGDQGRQDQGRVCSIYRINDGQQVWDGAIAHLTLSEYSAGAFSPHGGKITWPVEEHGGATSLWMTRVAGANAGESVRLTPPDGVLRSSTWSPDGRCVAFMWFRWPGDKIRLWVVELTTGQLEPLIEGPFGVGQDTNLGALGCHSWAL